MAIAVQEITEWKYNHTYLVEGQKILAYIPNNSKTPHYFAHPLTLDRRGRKFIELSRNPFVEHRMSRLVRVQGSRGDTYHVDLDAKTCTCKGFQFRGHCRHIEENC